MILRRVIEHFKKQEWTAIFLDFLIVVAGILIAFQITEWNGARRDRALEREYLERLYADLQTTLRTNTPDSNWDETRKAQQSLVLSALQSGVLKEEDRKAFETGLAYFGFVGGVEVRWATVEELKSTGAMNLIRDVSLRSQILEMDAELKRRQGIAGNFMDSIYAFRERLGDRYRVVNYSGERENVELTYDFNALAADAAFINMLSQIDLMARFRSDLNKPVLADIENLRDKVARRLGKEVGETP